jgi:hypothetical protein
MGNGPEVVLRGVTEVIGKASETAKWSTGTEDAHGRHLSGWCLRVRVRSVVSVHHQPCRNLGIVRRHVDGLFRQCARESVRFMEHGKGSHYQCSRSRQKLRLSGRLLTGYSPEM